MGNILEQRICKMIAISYALTEIEVMEAFDKTNSIDVILSAVRRSIINHTSLQFEIGQIKKD